MSGDVRKAEFRREPRLWLLLFHQRRNRDGIHRRRRRRRDVTSLGGRIPRFVGENVVKIA